MCRSPGRSDKGWGKDEDDSGMQEEDDLQIRLWSA